MIDPASVVDRQLAAYNEHDLDAFLATYAEDVRLSMSEGRTVRGRDQLRGLYEEQFAQRLCRAEVVGRLVERGWVVDHEVAHGLGGEPHRVLVAYRVREGLIDRVRFLS
ncbi:nuclear transport factor 2 family protein [Allokutzneria multivorans]|uniref:Nuclear transport factor 2 family protein n=1 Tax=Allokutzneria multivorans TaxID=1142134 RepID=A0ABP7TCH7_9PSEU